MTTQKQTADAYKLAYESLRDHILKELEAAETADGKDVVMSPAWERVHAWRLAAAPISVLDEHLQKRGGASVQPCTQKDGA